MAIFPEDPIEYAVEFVRRLRNHPDVVQIPSSRQVLSIPKLILSRYYRKGIINANDFIEISRVTSFPDNQDLAKDIAFEILFPTYQKNKLSQYFPDDHYINKKDNDDILSPQEKSQLEQLQELIDEIQLNAENQDIQEIEKFMEKLNKNRNKEPYNSALKFFKDDTEIYQEEIKSLEELLEAAKERFSEKINSLSPDELKAGAELGLNKLIEEKSIRDWEKIAGKALNNQNIGDELKKLMNSANFDNLIQSLKFLKEAKAINKEQFNQLKTQLSEKINDLDDLFNTAKNLGEFPDLNKQDLIKNSLKNSNFNHNLNLANSMDQFFGTDLRESLLKQYNENFSEKDMNISLESLANNAFASKDWNELFNKSLKKAINEASKNKHQSETLKSLAHQLQQLVNSCHNLHCGQKISQKIPNIIQKTLEASETPSELRNSVDFLRKIGLNPRPEDIEKVGKKLGMAEEDIYELIEPNYNLLKKLIEKKKADYQHLKNLMNLLKDVLNKERIKELVEKALRSNNRDALGALGNFNLSDAVNSAQKVGGEEGMKELISCLS
ncbi:MAG: hypothetical protein P8Y70_03955, partial [Candidatus Lokiarchaeota archaeon]